MTVPAPSVLYNLRNQAKRVRPSRARLPPQRAAPMTSGSHSLPRGVRCGTGLRLPRPSARRPQGSSSPQSPARNAPKV